MTEIRRREFLQGTLLAAAAAGGGLPLHAESKSRGPAPPQGEIVDTNVNLSRWPFRRLRGDDAPDLVELLRRQGVVEAWATSLDGLFHKDIAAVNARLAEECRRHGQGFLVPFGTVNPKLPDWEEDLRRCDEKHRMPGIRLHPNYHRYALDDPAFAQLLKRAAERGLLVQLAAWMEDERHQSPLMPVPEVDLTPLPGVVKSIPKLRLVLLNGFRTVRGKAVLELTKCEQVSFDIGLLDVIDGLGELLEAVPVERVVFGSHAPLFYFESTLLKLRESVLTPEQTRAILSENARRLHPSAP